MSKKQYPQRLARSVRGGLRPQYVNRTAWWRKRWILWMENLRLGARLGRGRSYAQLGQIKSLEIQPGEITAVIQGAQVAPYSVAIKMPVLPEKVLQRILEDAPFLNAQLYAHALPFIFEEKLLQAGEKLFPESRRDLSYHCTCKDWSRPCKHIAAALCLFADATAADPHLFLRFRGVCLPEIAPLLTPKRIPIENAKTIYSETNASLILRRLGTLPYWRGEEDLKKNLESAYLRAHGKALTALQGFVDLRLPEDHLGDSPMKF